MNLRETRYLMPDTLGGGVEIILNMKFEVVFLLLTPYSESLGFS